MTLARRAAAEFVGTALLVAVVVGSGVMGQALAAGNAAVALLANTVATGAGLVVLIHVFAPLSGAHFNPAVTLTARLQGLVSTTDALAYAAAQTAGGLAGSVLAHAMFGLPLWQVSTRLREGPAQALSEAVATFGLILTILASTRRKPQTTPMLVGLYITSAYWFTASTAFANPAVTVARAISDTFAGIAPASVPAFVAAQLIGAVAGLVFFQQLFKQERAA